MATTSTSIETPLVPSTEPKETTQSKSEARAAEYAAPEIVLTGFRAVLYVIRQWFARNGLAATLVVAIVAVLGISAYFALHFGAIIAAATGA